jgi:hypothetical protein
MLMLMVGFSLDNHGLCKCRDSNVFRVERDLVLGGPQQ